MKTAFLLLLVVALTFGDIYLHFPPGSNNRNRESNTNTQNANRLFDSQNNNKGGYCWAPKSTYYEGSFLQVEWTNQHGCGTSHSNVDCDLILQYMCSPTLRDGTTTDRIPYPPDNGNNDQDDPERRDGNGDYVYGMHEDRAYFRACSRRRRNKGLFYADQNNPDSPQKSARFTRQGNDATRYGYECPEERDYYPYWHPSPWKDIAIFTSRQERCAIFERESQNVKDKWWCTSDASDSNGVEYFETEDLCTTGNEEFPAGEWTKVDAWNLPPPVCRPAGWNRDNHLGNGPGGYANTYKWVLPSWAQVNDAAIPDTRDGAKDGAEIAPCVFRIRYNISSGDYRGGVEWTGEGYENGGFADRTLNGASSPVKQDPYEPYGKHPDYEEQGDEDEPWHRAEWPLVLAINTNQFARTFEERSHVFYIKKLPLFEAGKAGSIYNLVVRGKRGNIVQTYPAVEYDFVPNNLIVGVNDYVHIHMMGCDHNPAGNDGEGRQQTDRSNLVQLAEEQTQKLDKKTFNGLGNKMREFKSTTMWGTPGSYRALVNTWRMAHLEQYDSFQCESQTDTNCCYTLEQLEAKHGNNNNNKQQDPQNCAVLNGMGGNSFDSGLIKMTRAGTYHYMSSRNNNFTNRSQKGILVVSPAFSVPTMVAMVAGGGASVVAIVVSAAALTGQGSACATVRL